jgi:phosphatidylserine decarboxylase
MAINYPHPIIAKEGWPHVAIAGFILFVVHSTLGWAWSWPFWIIFVFVLQFFRDPGRLVPLVKDAVLSPADGRVIIVEKTFDPYARRDALKISVFMNVFNVHSNRSAVNGIVKQIEYFPGKFVNADLDKASTENERNAIIIDSNGHIVTLVQVAGLVARRILCYAHLSDKLKKGERYGFIRFGSRVDVYLPLEAEPLVSVGDIVSATSTILAKLPGLD